MTEGRLFSDAELAEMGTLTVDAIQRAIDDGEYEKAKGLSRRMYKEFLAMHDLYRDWVTATLSFVGRSYGDDVLYEALEEGCSAWISPLMERYGKADPRRKAQILATGLRGHLQPTKIEEDDEKLTFTFEVCPSCGRLVREGLYEPPRSFYKIAKPHLMTYGQANFPVYCAHDVFQEILPIEWTGVPLFACEPAEKPGEGPCRIHLYKNPQDIPAKYYERVGKKKPG